jgi:hypothetical protein
VGSLFPSSHARERGVVRLGAVAFQESLQSSCSNITFPQNESRFLLTSVLGGCRSAVVI